MRVITMGTKTYTQRVRSAMDQRTLDRGRLANKRYEEAQEGSAAEPAPDGATRCIKLKE